MQTLVEIGPSNASAFYFFIFLGQIFHLFRCVLSSVLPLRSVGRSNFDKGLHNLTTLIKKRHILNENCCCICIYIHIDTWRTIHSVVIGPRVDFHK